MKNKPLNTNEDPFAKYIKYSGLGFQMIATIAVFTFLGFKIDQYLQSKKPIGTAVLSLIGVCLSIFMVIRGVIKHKA